MTLEEETRARLLANILLLCLPMPFVNLALIFDTFRILPFFTPVSPVLLLALIFGLRIGMNIKIAGFLFGVSMELVFIEGLVYLASPSMLIGLVFVPFFSVMTSGWAISVFLLGLPTAFAFGLHRVFLPFFNLPTSGMKILEISFPSETINLLVFTGIVFAVACAVEKHALGIYAAYLAEKRAAAAEIKARNAKEQLLKTVFSSIPVPFFVKDELNRYTECSDSFYEYAGLSREAVIGKKPAEIYPPEIAKLFDAADARIFETGLSLGYTANIPRSADGRTHSVSILRTPLKNDTGGVVGSVGVLLDETDRLEKERGLESLLESNRGALALLGHDLRNPIGAFRDLVRSMETDAEIDPDEFREVLSEMGKSLDSLYRLLDELLDWAKADGGIERFDPQLVPLAASVDKVISLVALQASTKGVRVESHVSPDARIFADLSMLETVLRNLIGNALKFTRKGGNIVVSCVEGHSRRGVSLAVADSGIGMPYASIRSLFDSGQIRHQPGTGGEPGTGLGLPLCKRLVERHGGFLDIESVEGVGSLFSAFFPERMNTSRSALS